MDAEIKAIKALPIVRNATINITVSFNYASEDIVLCVPSTYPSPGSFVTSSVRGYTFEHRGAKTLSECVKECEDILLSQSPWGSPIGGKMMAHHQVTQGPSEAPIEVCASAQSSPAPAVTVLEVQDGSHGVAKDAAVPTEHPLLLRPRKTNFMDDLDGVYWASKQKTYISAIYFKVGEMDSDMAAVVDIMLNPLSFLTTSVCDQLQINSDNIVIRLCISDIGDTTYTMEGADIQVMQASNRNSVLMFQMTQILTRHLQAVWNTRLSIPSGSEVSDVLPHVPGMVQPYHSPSGGLTRTQLDIKRKLLSMGYGRKTAHLIASMSDTVEDALNLDQEFQKERPVFEGLSPMGGGEAGGMGHTPSPGIWVPSPRSRDDPNKAIPVRTKGFFVQLAQYCKSRILTCCDYCVMCDAKLPLKEVEVEPKYGFAACSGCVHKFHSLF